jgi:hypothetical protein
MTKMLRGPEPGNMPFHSMFGRVTRLRTRSGLPDSNIRSETGCGRNGRREARSGAGRLGARSLNGASHPAGRVHGFLVVGLVTLLAIGFAGALHAPSSSPATGASSGVHIAQGPPSELGCVSFDTATLTASPTSALPGAYVGLDGTGFSTAPGDTGGYTEFSLATVAGDLIGLDIGFAKATGPGGSFSADLHKGAPGGIASGNYELWAEDGVGDCASALFDVTAAPPPSLGCLSYDATLTASPASGTAGTAVTLTGHDFYPEGSTNIDWGLFDGTGTPVVVGSYPVPFTALFDIPAGYTPGLYAFWGADVNSNCGAALFNLGQYITVTPNQGPSGTLTGASYTVTGYGFSDSSPATVSFNAVLQAPIGCSDGTWTSGDGTNISTDPSGGFVCTFTVPSGTAPATYLVVGTDMDTSTTTPPVNFKVTLPLLKVSPGRGPIGATYTVTGTRFSVMSGATVSFDGVSQTPRACRAGTWMPGDGVTITTGVLGGFVCTFSVPTEVAGTYAVVGTDLATGTPSLPENFKVTAPVITILGSPAPVGASYQETSSGFSSSSGATVSFNGALQTPNSCSIGTFTGTAITSDTAGVFRCTFTVPDVTAPAAYPVVGTDSATGLTSERMFLVTG